MFTRKKWKTILAFFFLDRSSAYPAPAIRETSVRRNINVECIVKQKAILKVLVYIKLFYAKKNYILPTSLYLNNLKMRVINVYCYPYVEKLIVANMLIVNVEREKNKKKYLKKIIFKHCITVSTFGHSEPPPLYPL